MCIPIGDIWSENGIAIYAVMLHYIDSDWEIQARLAFAKGLEDLPHNGENIIKLTCEGLHSCGIGKSVMEVKEDIFICVRLMREVI